MQRNIPTAKYKSVTKDNIERDFHSFTHWKHRMYLKQMVCAGKVLIIDTLEEAERN